MPKKPPNVKFKSKVEKEEVLLEIARLERRGYSQREIAERVGITQPAVHWYMKQIMKRYQKEIGEEKSAYISKVNQQYNEVMKELWEAWEHSKLPIKKVVREKALPVRLGKQVPTIDPKTGQTLPMLPLPDMDEMRVMKEVETEEGRCPDPQYMRALTEVLRDLRELRGLDPPKNIKATVETTSVWDQLARELPPNIHKDIVEAEIVRAIELTDVPVVDHGESGMVDTIIPQKSERESYDSID